MALNNKSGNIVADIVNSEIHYIRELRSLYNRELSSIEFDTLYLDVLDPLSADVKSILERATRYICKAAKTKIVNVTTNTQTIAYRKKRRPCSSFTVEDVLLYIHEFEQLLGTKKLTLPPFTKDRLINTWKELMRCYVETKRYDRLNDYIVTIGIGVSSVTNDDWKIFITAKSKSVELEDSDSRWTILEHNEYLFS